MDYNWLYTHYAFLMYFNQIIILQISWRSTLVDEVLVLSKYKYSDGNKESSTFRSEYCRVQFKKVAHLFKNDSLWYYM